MDIHQLRISLAETLERTKFAGKAYFVGGAVRDLLIHRQTPEYDITVELPEGGIKLAQFLHKELPASNLLVYPKFGTASLVWQGTRLDFVMTRSEVYRPGNRNPKVQFASLPDDVMRRDFGINALLLSVSGGNLLDLSRRGLKDLHEGVIRTLGEPGKVFAEDPVRMLRAIRFSASLGFVIDPETWQGLLDSACLINTLSQTQITAEFARIMVSSPSPHLGNRNEAEGEAVTRGFGLLLESGIMDCIVPEQQKKLEILSEKRFSLTPQELLDYFGHLDNSRMGKMMKIAKEYWFDHPDISKESILSYLKEQDQ
ncbi:MAG TPA: hypothetical protein PL124_04265 [Candidatus Cloacimonadota bacterium]|nr:hypothetical protein [Candidatus Cloacimonadota bacterium]HPS38607.1 hypothetical protein [Candidatus Cloacimonadota bacterium]